MPLMILISSLGEGIAFGNIRPFAPGDRTKRINERASLRLAELYVNEYRQERDAGVARARHPGERGLTVSLAWAYMRCKDHGGLIEYGRAFR